jgi:hypothetical protein
LTPQTEQILQERLKSSPVAGSVDLPEVQKQIREQVKAAIRWCRRAISVWQIDLGFAKNYLRGKPLQLRVKFNSAQKALRARSWRCGRSACRKKPISGGASR